MVTAWADSGTHQETLAVEQLLACGRVLELVLPNCDLPLEVLDECDDSDGVCGGGCLDGPALQLGPALLQHRVQLAHGRTQLRAKPAQQLPVPRVVLHPHPRLHLLVVHNNVPKPRLRAPVVNRAARGRHSAWEGAGVGSCSLEQGQAGQQGRSARPNTQTRHTPAGGLELDQHALPFAHVVAQHLLHCSRREKQMMYENMHSGIVSQQERNRTQRVPFAISMSQRAW